MDKKFVYLFTEKKEDTVKKVVYNEWQRCLDQFNMEVALMEHDGWQVVVNAMYDDEPHSKADQREVRRADSRPVPRDVLQDSIQERQLPKLKI